MVFSSVESVKIFDARAGQGYAGRSFQVACFSNHNSIIISIQTIVP